QRAAPPGRRAHHGGQVTAAGRPPCKHPGEGYTMNGDLPQLGKGMNILLIDDDVSLRKSLRLALEAMGHRAAEAADRAQAEAQLARGSFDLAFLDLRLAREGGLDVLPALLRRAPGLPVVVVTAYATIETAVEAMRRGAFDYLPKPF